MTIDQLAALALERRATHGGALSDGIPQVDLAEKYGADPHRLTAVLAG